MINSNFPPFGSKTFDAFMASRFESLERCQFIQYANTEEENPYFGRYSSASLEKMQKAGNGELCSSVVWEARKIQDCILQRQVLSVFAHLDKQDHKSLSDVPVEGNSPIGFFRAVYQELLESENALGIAVFKCAYPHIVSLMDQERKFSAILNKSH